MKSKVSMFSTVFLIILCVQVSGQDDRFTVLQNNIRDQERILNRTNDWTDRQLYDNIIDQITEARIR